jgi:hypothetical protein
MRTRRPGSVSLCLALSLALVLHFAIALGDSPSQPLAREVSLADVTAPIIPEPQASAEAPQTDVVDLESLDAATSSSSEPIELETQASATMTAGLLSGAAAGLSRDSLRERSSALGALRRVSEAFLSTSIAKQQQEHQEEEIARQLDEEDKDWDGLESDVVALELDEKDARDSAAVYISTPNRPRRVVRRVVRRVPKAPQVRFREMLASTDSEFQSHAKAQAGAKHGKVVRVIKRIIKIYKKPKRVAADESVPIVHERLMTRNDVVPLRSAPRFAEVRTDVKAQAETEAETEAGARQRLLERGKMFSKQKHTRRATVETSSQKAAKGPKKSKAQKLEDCTACMFIWAQVEMDVGSARYVEDVQASFEHNCMDAQKSSIFYSACEDMYDDMYALTDDYMSNKFPVKKICKRAKLC